MEQIVGHASSNSFLYPLNQQKTRDLFSSGGIVFITLKPLLLDPLSYPSYYPVISETLQIVYYQLQLEMVRK